MSTNEPVAWAYRYGSGEDDWDVDRRKAKGSDIPLYRKQTPLTLEQIITLFNIHQQDLNFPRLVADVRVVEKAHGIGEE
jgi:hypothetical protein